ncbi:MAG: hypothetical protein GY710_06430 [Desulfobacteraceae bacterium]|nr:hypothetical protein [Desulfobacteraceae bacterium]
MGHFSVVNSSILTVISLLTPFPGSPIAENPSKFGITIHDNDYENYTFSRPTISTTNISQEDLLKFFSETLIGLVEEDIKLLS